MIDLSLLNLLINASWHTETFTGYILILVLQEHKAQLTSQWFG